jgi:hypothetical protein
MNRLVAREISSDIYERFLRQTPHSFFLTAEWLQVISENFSVKVVFLGYFLNEDLHAVSALQIRRILGVALCGAPIRKTATPPATEFCAPAEHAGPALLALRHWAKKHGIAYLQVSVRAEVCKIGCGHSRIESFDNLELDLSRPIEILWKSLSDSPRREVRLAVKNHVHIHWRHSDDLLREYESMLASIYAGQGIGSNYSHRLYRSLLEQRQRLGLRVLCATHRGEVLSQIWLFRDSERCYYWDAASFDKAKRLKANHLLLWCAIKWAKRHDLKTFDFVGTSVGGRGGSRPGIGRFKQSMGGRPKNYVVLYWYHPLFGAALDGYRLFQRLRQRIKHRLKCRANSPHKQAST